MRQPLNALVRAATAALVVALAGMACAGTPSWSRRLEFASRLLRNHGYADLSKQVVNQLLDDPAIKGPERTELYKAVGEYHVEAIESVKGKDAFQQCIWHLGEARKYFTKYAEEKKGGGFEMQVRITWLSVNRARVYSRMLEEADTPKADQAKHKAEAVSAYRAAIKEFEDLAKAKKAEEDKAKGLAKLKEDANFVRVRNEHVSVRIYLNDTRVELGKFLKKTGADAKEWRALIDAAVKDYRAMLFEFGGAAGLAQINVKLAKALMELGPEGDKEAIERLDEVWENRQAYLDFLAIPCEAMHVKAMILVRQKKHSEATDVLDDMISRRTGRGWEPAKLPIDQVSERVTDILQNLDEGEIQKQYDAKALAESFVLLAEAYAARGKAAEDAKKPAKESERLYGMAYEIALGVWEAKLMLPDPKYAGLVQTWREKGRRPLSLTDLNIMIRKLLEEGERFREKDPERSRAAYLKAAKLYTEVAGRTKPEPDQVRKIWDSVAKCYYAGGDCMSAYVVFTGLSRWSLRPQPPHPVAYGFAQAAVSAIRAQYDRSVKDKASPSQIAFEKKLLGDANLWAESLSIEGPEGHAIAEARRLRGEKKFHEALKLLDGVRQESRVYPHALHERAIILREMFLALPKEERAALAGQRLLKGALEAFQGCLDFARKRLPELKGDDAAEDRKRLIEVIGSTITIYCDTLLKDYVNQPARVLDLTGNLAQDYPGIEAAVAYPLILYTRMHAAYVIATGKDADQAAKALAPLDDAWRRLREFPDFRYLPNACKMGAMAYNEVAKGLEEQAKKATGAAKADLEKRAAAARDRGLEFYLELLSLAPHQTLVTYHYVLGQLEKRVSDNKNADYRRIVELAPRALGMFRPGEADPDRLVQVKLILANAYFHLRNWREGITVLEDANGRYEAEHQKRMKIYEDIKRRAEEAGKQAPKLPARHPLQAQVLEALGRAYVETKTKLKEAKLIFAERVKNYYPSREKPEHWVAMLYLCRAAHLEGDHEEAVKYLFVVSEGIAANPVTTGEGAPKDFLDLAAKVQQEVRALPESLLKRKLLDALDGILKKLRDAVSKGDKR
ncbi:MAG: hypothetical protein FJ290_00925 [Planctomycetes bacterium]|nr:hypothetical protein [Planctomycetota bacterium]